MGEFPIIGGIISFSSKLASTISLDMAWVDLSTEARSNLSLASLLVVVTSVRPVAKVA